MKSAIEKLIEWLEIENAKRNHTTTGIVWRHYDHIIDMANELLAAERSKPVDGLVEELERHLVAVKLEISSIRDGSVELSGSPKQIAINELHLVEEAVTNMLSRHAGAQEKATAKEVDGC